MNNNNTRRYRAKQPAAGTGNFILVVTLLVNVLKHPVL